MYGLLLPRMIINVPFLMTVFLRMKERVMAYGTAKYKAIVSKCVHPIYISVQRLPVGFGCEEMKL